MRRHGCTLTTLTLLCACALSGCATRDSGYKISDETIAFVQPGKTTRADIIENLGTPLYELKDPHVVAYSWGKMRATAGKPAVRDETMQGRQMGYAAGPPPIEETGLVETRRWIFCVRLDDKEQVTKLGKIRLEGAASLENAVRQWATANP